MKILITAFEPFGDEQINASWEVLKKTFFSKKNVYLSKIKNSLTEGKMVSDLEIVMVLKNYKKQQMNDAGGN